MWQEKLKLYREEKEKELAELERKKYENKYKDDLVKAEIERLIRENVPKLEGFLPKGVLLKEDHLKYLNVEES